MIMCHSVCIISYAAGYRRLWESIGQENSTNGYSQAQVGSISVLSGKWRKRVSSDEKDLSMSTFLIL